MRWEGDRKTNIAGGVLGAGDRSSYPVGPAWVCGVLKSDLGLGGVDGPQTKVSQYCHPSTETSSNSDPPQR